MKKLKTVLTLMLAVVLLCGTGAGGNRAAAGKKIIATYLDEYFSAWYYVPETVPKGLGSNSNMSFIVRLQEEGQRSNDDITKASIKFVSGDEFLRDAVRFEMMKGQGLLLLARHELAGLRAEPGGHRLSGRIQGPAHRPVFQVLQHPDPLLPGHGDHHFPGLSQLRRQKESVVNAVIQRQRKNTLHLQRVFSLR